MTPKVVTALMGGDLLINCKWFEDYVRMKARLWSKMRFRLMPCFKDFALAGDLPLSSLGNSHAGCQHIIHEDPSKVLQPRSL